MSQEVAEPPAEPEERPVLRGRRTFRKHRARWKTLARALGEIAVVTVGILIAFALEAWWDNRATAEREQVHLRALASDFQQNVTVLRALIEVQESVTSSSQELLERARASQTNSSEQVVELMNQVFNSARYDPVMGAYEALVNSGGLMLIRDEALRASLAEFAAAVGGQYAETWANEHYLHFAREFAGRYMLHAQDEQPTPERDRIYGEMLRDPRFQEHLVMRRFAERDMGRKYRQLLQRAESVLAQLREQMRE